MSSNEFDCLTDEELVSRIAKNKNTLLFGVLYDRYSEVVFNKCLNFVSYKEDEARDLMQDIFLRVFIKLSTFKGQSKFSTWLYAFTYNFCVNYVTRNNDKKIEREALNIEGFDKLQIEVSDDSLFQLKVDKLKKAMEVIPANDKMILLLKYQDNMSIKTIASILEIGESAVKMRLKRAKANIVQVYRKLQ